MSRPITDIVKQLGINPNPCAPGDRKLGPTERRNWQNLVVHLSDLSPLFDVAGDLSTFINNVDIDEVTNFFTNNDQFGNSLVRFQLREVLTRNGGYALAYPLYYVTNPAEAWEPSGHPDDETFQVKDWSDYWEGEIGDKGWARRAVLNSAQAIVVLMDPKDTTPECMVQVNHSSSTAGHLKAANASNVHPGRLVTFTNGTKTNGADIWILFTDHYDTDSGAVIAEQGRFYGPAKRAGKLTVSSVTRPLYVCHVSEHQYLAQATGDVAKGSSETFKLYHTSSESDSGLTVTAECKFNAYTANKWAIVTRINGVYYANQIEC